MRILQISDKAPDGGGVAAHVAAISAQLKGRGHEIASLRVGGPNDEAPGHGQRYRLPPSYGPLRGYLLRRALHDVLRNARPDLIHVHECFTTLSAPLLASLRRFAPVVGTLHDVRPFCYLMTRRFAPTGDLCNRRCGITCFASGCVRPQRPGDLLRLPRRWATDRLNLGEWRRLERVVVPST